MVYFYSVAHKNDFLIKHPRIFYYMHKSIHLPEV